MTARVGLCAAGALFLASAAMPAGAVTFAKTIAPMNLAAMTAPATIKAPVWDDIDGLADEVSDGIVAADTGMGWLHDVDGSEILKGVTPGMTRPGISVAVPEPQSWALMILGFGAAGALLRSRRRPAELAAG